MKDFIKLVLTAIVFWVLFFSAYSVYRTYAHYSPITICHKTESETNQYVQIIVNHNATGGHFDNEGTPLFGHEVDLLFQGEVSCPEPSATPTTSPVPTPTSTPVATSTPVPTSTPSSSPSATPTSTPSPEATKAPETADNGQRATTLPPYNPPVCSVALPKRPSFSFERLSPTLVGINWNEDNENTTHWSINYGYTYDSLIYGIPYLPLEARSIDIGSLEPNRHIWVQLGRWNSDSCLVLSPIIDP